MLTLTHQVVLGSKSPRRQQLLQDLGLAFTVRTIEVDEHFPDHLVAQDIPMYLAAIKAEAYRSTLAPNELLITADTVVWINGQVLNKPGNRQEALEMLRTLNGQSHEVYTAVGLTTTQAHSCFYDRTEVTFSQLEDAELEHYVDHYKPFDKAGSYGVQDWIGLIGIASLRGSYFNVMGLPVHKLYHALKAFAIAP